MATDNHAEFAKQVLRAVAFLYDRHPRAELIGADHILRPPLDQSDIDQDRLDSASGTLRWLYDNGIIHGDDEMVGNGWIAEAQLTASAYRTLRERDSNVTDSSLGHAAVRAAADEGSREESVVAELILLRLT